MKSYRFLLIATLCVSALISVMTGCKYDVAAPLWNSPPSTTVASTITSIDPAQATAGVNVITIHGTNFNGALDSNRIKSYFIDSTNSHDTTIVYSGVYFNNLPAEILDCSSTMIKVRRPNLASDACTLTVVPSKVLIAAKYSPYKVSSVVQTYGSYVDNISLSTVAVDSAGNVYFVNSISYNILKIAPDGTQSTLATAAWQPADMRIGPDGNIYLTAFASTSRREITMVNVSTKTVTRRWRYLQQGINAEYCDFGKNGFLYLGGGSDLYILNQATPISGTTYPVKASGLYPSSQGYSINALRVFNGYVYVAVQTDAGQQGIWKHLINADGSLDTTRTLVLDWNSTGFASSTIKNFALSRGSQYSLYPGKRSFSKFLCRFFPGCRLVL